VCRLLQEVELRGRRFRLTGVGVGQLVDDDGPQQLELLTAVEPPARAKGEALQGVLSEVRRKFGHQALFPADAGSSEREGSAGGLTKSVDDDG
jgi:DNA polymerase IV